jgi:ABC-type nitrate/sulfonate/bicarbonate transport system substrate-binding protein
MNGGNVKGLLFGALLLAILAGGFVAYRTFGPTGGSDPNADSGKENLGELREVPFIFWGGDVATFEANGGLETTPDSLLGKHGLKVKLTPGDDFDKQVENYLANKSPFLRGTLSMLGQASDKLTAKAETTPVVFLQLTWSAGDHMVGRAPIKKLDDLKGKRIALQKSGPHVGMLHDILRTARLEWRDITVVWTDDVSGDKGPAAKFRSDPTIDACFVITPDMVELTSAPETGGVESIGEGTKSSIKGAHVVVSTAHMSRSIADVYACRKDFYDKNRAWVNRFVAGYLKACEELMDVKKKAETAKQTGKKDEAAETRYQKAIQLAQKIWGADPQFKDQVKKEDDVDGLISDAVFVGLPGNEAFFKNKGNLTGFPFKLKQAVRLPADPAKEPLKDNPREFLAAELDYPSLRKLGDLRGKEITGGRIGKIELGEKQDEQTIFSFKISFEPDQSVFPDEKYRDDFQRALELASLFGNTVVAIRGHADPSLMVQETISGGRKMGVIETKGDTWIDTKTSKPINFEKIDEVLSFLDRTPGLIGVDTKQAPAKMVKNLQRLSDERSAKVRQTVIDFAKRHGLVLDESQFRSKGEGVRKALGIGTRPRSDFAANRRVEFSIIKVPLKDVGPDGFDL